MTVQLTGFIVTLATPIRDDDAQATLAAIRQLRGVIDVVPVVADPAHYMAVVQARHELQLKIFAVFDL